MNNFIMSLCYFCNSKEIYKVGGENHHSFCQEIRLKPFKLDFKIYFCFKIFKIIMYVTKFIFLNILTVPFSSFKYIHIAVKFSELSHLTKLKFNT